jgi:hypothetical protein
MKEAPCEVAPRVFGDIVDFACDLDRSFFAKHRMSRTRVRLYLPGEFWPLDTHVDRALTDRIERAQGTSFVVDVTLLAPGIRARRPLFDVRALDALGKARSRRT